MDERRARHGRPIADAVMANQLPNMFRGVIEVQAGDLGDDVDKRLADRV